MKKSGQTDWNHFGKDANEETDYSDIAETDADFWKSAPVVVPPKKVHLSIRIDEDVVTWFKQFGKGYQTRINAVLRSYIRGVTEKA